MNDPVSVEYVSSFTQANQSLMLHLATELLGEGGRIGDFQRFVELAQVQQDYLQQMGTLWFNTMMQSAAESIQPAKGDRRFVSEDWQKSPFHDFLKQSYLINTRYVNGLIDRAAGDERTRRRLSFFARQILDALSPSNYLAGNPQSLRLAMETGGESLTTGIRNLIDDIGKGRISMTDEKAFEVGGNLAITPGAVIFENELIQVIQYKALTDTDVRERPLVMIPPAINKFYVLDLQPANSFVRYAVEQGHTVFMVSWRNVGADQGHLTWDDYLELGIMRAIDVALSVTGADKVNALGFCVGGTMLGCAAAILAARGERKIKSLTLLTTMLDFTESGEIGLLIDEASVASREQTIGKAGIMPGRELAFVFSTLRGNDLIWPYVVGNYLEGRQPDAFDILYWNADSTNLPGPMLLVRAQHLSREQSAQSDKDHSMWDGGRSDADRHARLRARVPRGSYRPLADRIQHDPADFERGALHARRERTYRGRDQSGLAQQAQLLDRRQARRTAGALARDSTRGSGELVDRLERLARDAGRRRRSRALAGWYCAIS